MDTLCSHIKNATYDDLYKFECDSCSSNPNDCDCYDCYVYCKICNKVYYLSCEELCEIMEDNEEFEEWVEDGDVDE